MTTTALIAKQYIEWLWQSNALPFCLAEPAEWQKYTDVETEIIEEAFQQGLPEVLLDDYHIVFARSMQISNNDEKKQRPVKRVVDRNKDEREKRVRAERFLEDSVLPSNSFINWQIEPTTPDFVQEACSHYGVRWEKGITCQSVLEMWIEKAAEGFIIEAKKVGKQREGEWMAKRLLEQKNGSKQQVEQLCVKLYCMGSFLYRKLNETMRLQGDFAFETLWKSRVPTLGPFAVLLNSAMNFTRTNMIVYRGATMTNEQIEQFRLCVVSERKIQLPAFTSTTLNPNVAEFFGSNVLFVIDLEKDTGSLDMSPYSNYPDEQELLIFDGFPAKVTSCHFDEIANKWIIKLWGLRSSDL
ncbi:unnamed protein product [Rotaria magnacalcarata]|uniref:NAD(P)(+)--arginine ADP-ribosyltransferase n=1 Tax=Rotaria magnacalcarata TaxID=392030 RepID=A0A816VB36_9BILA|nr:unnamed protein product [Rotaria magnacalcarata]CAF2059608.1 unnamed protein product [Rotaria magnacalcarata]CAF2119115.1 unnamed protein product [Rotaria magnacalcarata]CAF3944602.1 unnamed protein product [Rotaria magnacalcarata]CAF4108834.1 unnamed protein product [Rotaria magnacalcarata]